MTRFNNRAIPKFFGIALIGAAFLLPTTAANAVDPASVRPAHEVPSCEISDATLEWGILERWRSYISGSIANGEWELEGDNVEYETPSFTWSEGEGELAEAGDHGEIEFEGVIHFTGHDGALQVDLADPTLEIVDNEEAYLLLDLKSTKMSGEPDISIEQERAVLLDISDAVTLDGDSFTLKEATGKLTAEGAAAFGGFYSAGEEVDPVTVTATATGGCVFGAVAPGEDTNDAATETDEDGSATPTEAVDEDVEEPATDETFPWVPLIIGGVALLVIGVAGGMLIFGRKKTNSDFAQTEESGGVEEL